MRRRVAVLLLLGAVPLGLALGASHALADSAGTAFGATVSSAARLLPQAPAPVPPVDSTAAALLPTAPEVAAAKPKPVLRRAAKALPAAKPPLRGIFVRRQAVAAAVRAGVRPSAVPVAQTPAHPAGLLVNGWGGAGTALRDGDIIVKLAGMTPRSLDDVIAVVAASYKNQTYAVSGQIWRAGETLSATVELPRPKR